MEEMEERKGIIESRSRGWGVDHGSSLVARPRRKRRLGAALPSERAATIYEYSNPEAIRLTRKWLALADVTTNVERHEGLALRPSARGHAGNRPRLGPQPATSWGRLSLARQHTPTHHAHHRQRNQERGKRWAQLFRAARCAPPACGAEGAAEAGC